MYAKFDQLVCFYKEFKELEIVELDSVVRFCDITVSINRNFNRSYNLIVSEKFPNKSYQIIKVLD